MKVLWLSKTPGLYPINRKIVGYNGGGWISSLQKLLLLDSDIDLGVVFISSERLDSIQEQNVKYFPIKSHKMSPVKKLAKYYGLINTEGVSYNSDVLNIINEFSPDLIHIFGLENEMIDVINSTNIPIVVHLQGLLGPCANAFWPVDYNSLSFIWPFSVQEWIIRNGFRYEKANLLRRAMLEKQNFSKLSNVMGCTEWDKQVTNLLSPLCNYYHVNEVLREIFYQHSGEWSVKNGGKFIITSTISNTIYKGLDVIMKTAKLLKENTKIDIEWNVIGINQSARIVKFFENKLGFTTSSIGIKICGILSENLLCQKLLDSNLYVHPSYIDNSPNSVCEAQLLGLPVIACNVGGVSTLIEHGKTGYLVPANAPYELAFYIKSLYSKPYLCSILGEGAYNVASMRHDKQIILHTLKETYISIINSQK